MVGVSDLGPPPVDRGKVGILWVVQSIAAIFVVAVAFATLFVPFSPISTKVDPATLPPGTGYVVVFNSTGPAAYLHCPSMSAWLGGDRPEICSDPVHSMTVSVTFAGVGTIVAVACFVLVRRARRREKYRATEWVRPVEPVLEFRNSGMPGVFWLALVLVGGLTTLLAVGTVTTMASGGRTSFFGVAFYGAILFQIAWVNGVRRAYRVRVDGTSIRWTAPLRSVAVPLDTISAAVVPDQGTFVNPEGVGRIELADGRTLSVTLPDAYGRWRFATFCDTLRERHSG